MALFTKKTCAMCGGPKGLFGEKLRDGTTICGKCKEKLDVNCEGSGYFTKCVEVSDMTFPEFQQFSALREANKERLASFVVTRSICNDRILLDETVGEVVFCDRSLFSDRQELMKANPPVFHMNDLCFSTVAQGEIKVSQTITGKAKSDAAYHLVVCFDDPLYSLISLSIGKTVVKEGFLFDKVRTDPSVVETANYFDSALLRNVRWTFGETGAVDPTEDRFWRLARQAKDQLFFNAVHMGNLLERYYGKNRKVVHAIRKTYKL